jgi:hypothetical protein
MRASLSLRRAGMHHICELALIVERTRVNQSDLRLTQTQEEEGRHT